MRLFEIETDYFSYSDAIGAFDKGNCLYRGMTDYGDMIIRNPSVRKSANGSNFMNQYFSYSKKWKNYPKRNNSWIMSSSYKYAYEYVYSEDKTMYYCFPKNNSKIGICPREDMWFSFEKISTLDIFGKIIEHNYKKYINYTIPEYTSNNVFDIIKKVIDFNNINNVIATSTSTSILIPRPFPKTFNEFEEMFSPQNNGFTVTSPSLYQQPNNRECWSDSEMLFIKISQIDEWIDIWKK
jgi:hypothetical protein